jgi:hypothetical protein
MSNKFFGIIFAVAIVIIFICFFVLVYDYTAAPTCNRTITIWQKPNSFSPYYITTDGCRLSQPLSWDMATYMEHCLVGRWCTQTNTFNVTIRTGITRNVIVDVEGYIPYTPQPQPTPPQESNCRLCRENHHGV